MSIDQADIRAQKHAEWQSTTGLKPYEKISGHLSRIESLYELGKSLKPGEERPSTMSVLGRIRTIRDQGKVIFMDIVHGLNKIQLVFRSSVLFETQFQEIRFYDRGDWLQATGKLMRTKRGELSLEISAARLLSKCLEPLPQQDQVLEIESRYRQPYLNFITNPSSLENVVTRHKALQSIRRVLNGQGFIEVETPMLQSLPGGANARPFKTHHNSLKQDMYLRVSPELYLKRMIVAGLPQVYEIGKNFRNEGLSVRHNPEFTMLELYQAGANAGKMLEICWSIIERLQWDLQLPLFTPGFPFVVKTMEKVVCEQLNISSFVLHQEWYNDESGHSYEEYVQNKFETVSSALIEPTFVHGFPMSDSPLAISNHNGVADRYELYIGGMEIANMYSEQNNPQIQESVFQEQVRGQEDKAIDEDYINALRHGMPPTGGLGIGIDRLMMVLLNLQSIRETILFPTLRVKPE